jgi:hypothetical protein
LKSMRRSRCGREKESGSGFVGRRKGKRVEEVVERSKTKQVRARDVEG